MSDAAHDTTRDTPPSVLSDHFPPTQRLACRRYTVSEHKQREITRRDSAITLNVHNERSEDMRHLWQHSLERVAFHQAAHLRHTLHLQCTVEIDLAIAGKEILHCGAVADIGGETIACDYIADRGFVREACERGGGIGISHDRPLQS